MTCVASRSTEIRAQTRLDTWYSSNSREAPRCCSTRTLGCGHRSLDERAEGADSRSRNKSHDLNAFEKIDNHSNSLARTSGKRKKMAFGSEYTPFYF